MKIIVVSTTNERGWDNYACEMFYTFNKYWSDDIELHFCAEDFQIHEMRPNVTINKFRQWFYSWRYLHRDNLYAHGRDPKRNRPNKQEYDFKQDCVRFSHKVAALTDIALNQECDLLIWMDADIITEKPVTPEWLDGLFPHDAYMAWLYREKTYPECGFLMFRGKHPMHLPFMQRMREIYETNEVFGLSETHDSYVFQYVAHAMGLNPFNLAGDGSRHHSVFDYSPLRERMEHLKGPRKKPA